MEFLAIFFIFMFIVVVVFITSSIKIVPQARQGIVERFGRYKGTLNPGLNFITPFFDRMAYKIDLREQVVSFPPQQVITEDNLQVNIDTVIYFQVTDSKLAIYENTSYVNAIEQLTMATLRNIIGKMSLETALTSRETINNGLRGELDGATGKWGIRVNRVELKSIDPPASIIDAMEKQMRADRNKRAAILDAEGESRSAILNAEGAKQATILQAEAAKTSAILKAQAIKESSVLEAEGERQASILRAQGESQAILAVSQAIHDGNPDQKLLAFKYLETLPEIAKGENNTQWIIPAELTRFLSGFTSGLGEVSPKAVIPADDGGVAQEHRMNINDLGAEYKHNSEAEEIAEKVREAEEQVKVAQGMGDLVSGVQPTYAHQKTIEGIRQQAVEAAKPAPSAPAPTPPAAPEPEAPVRPQPNGLTTPPATPPRMNLGEMRLSDVDPERDDRQ